VIAALGLAESSSVVLVASMLVSPLMVIVLLLLDCGLLLPLVELV